MPGGAHDEFREPAASVHVAGGQLLRDDEVRVAAGPVSVAGHSTIIGLLARRLVYITGWVAHEHDTASPPIGYFGASHAGTALGAACRLSNTWILVSVKALTDPGT